MLVLSLRDLNPTTIHQVVFLLHIMTEIYLKNATKSPLLHSYFHHFSQNPSVFFLFYFKCLVMDPWIKAAGWTASSEHSQRKLQPTTSSQSGQCEVNVIPLSLDWY